MPTKAQLEAECDRLRMEVMVLHTDLVSARNNLRTMLDAAKHMNAACEAILKVADASLPLT